MRESSSASGYVSRSLLPRTEIQHVCKIKIIKSVSFSQLLYDIVSWPSIRSTSIFGLQLGRYQGLARRAHDKIQDISFGRSGSLWGFHRRCGVESTGHSISRYDTFSISLSSHTKPSDCDLDQPLQQMVALVRLLSWYYSLQKGYYTKSGHAKRDVELQSASIKMSRGAMLGIFLDETLDAWFNCGCALPPSGFVIVTFKNTSLTYKDLESSLNTLVDSYMDSQEEYARKPVELAGDSQSDQKLSSTEHELRSQHAGFTIIRKCRVDMKHLDRTIPEPADQSELTASIVFEKPHDPYYPNLRTLTVEISRHNRSAYAKEVLFHRSYKPDSFQR